MEKEMREILFSRGYLITSDLTAEGKLTNLDFFDKHFHNGCNFFIHKKVRFFSLSSKGNLFFLIGHAYNPFTGESDENLILRRLSSSGEKLISELNNLTGIFVFGIIYETGYMKIFNDAAAMLSVYYTKEKDKFYLSSHSAFIAKIVKREMSDFAIKLKKHKFFRLYGASMPGRLSPYTDILRLSANCFLTYDDSFKITRFYPEKPLTFTKTEEEYQNTINDISSILTKNLALVSQKWSKPFISLTGGWDSKLAIASACGMQNKFEAFTYISKEGEREDAEVAAKIAKELNFKHTVFNIPLQKEFYPEFDEAKKVFSLNIGEIGESNDNDIMKRLYLMSRFKGDVEVKSWVSEIARANYRKKHPYLSAKPSPRLYTLLSRVLLSKSLLRETDLAFQTFFEETSLESHLFNYDWTSLYHWEIRCGSWGSLYLNGEQKVSNDITIIYNNRRLLELFLSIPLEKRLTDAPYKDIIQMKTKGKVGENMHHISQGHSLLRRVFEKSYLTFLRGG